MARDRERTSIGRRSKQLQARGGSRSSRRSDLHRVSTRSKSGRRCWRSFRAFLSDGRRFGAWTTGRDASDTARRSAKDAVDCIGLSRRADRLRPIGAHRRATLTSSSHIGGIGSDGTDGGADRAACGLASRRVVGQRLRADGTNLEQSRSMQHVSKIRMRARSCRTHELPLCLPHDLRMFTINTQDGRAHVRDVREVQHPARARVLPSVSRTDSFEPVETPSCRWSTGSDRAMHLERAFIAKAETDRCPCVDFPRAIHRTARVSASKVIPRRLDLKPLCASPIFTTVPPTHARCPVCNANAIVARHIPW
jgi:hypothetical protein